MDWSTIEAGWKAYQGNAQRRWHKLSVAQVDATQGRREQLSAQLQAAYRLDPAKAEQQIADWQSRQHPMGEATRTVRA